MQTLIQFPQEIFHIFRLYQSWYFMKWYFNRLKIQRIQLFAQNWYKIFMTCIPKKCTSPKMIIESFSCLHYYNFLLWRVHRVLNQIGDNGYIKLNLKIKREGNWIISRDIQVLRESFNDSLDNDRFVRYKNTIRYRIDASTKQKEPKKDIS